MKHSIFILIFTLLSLGVKAQHFTIDELQKAVSCDNWSEVNQLLSAKGWEFYDSKKEDADGFVNVTWTYKKNVYDDKANAWFNLYLKEGENKVCLQFSEISAYEEIQSQLDKYGFKMTGTEIEDAIASAYYANDDYNIAFKSQKRQRDGYSNSSISTYYVNIGRKKSGLQKEYYSNGNIKEEYTLVKGKANGPFKSYYESGELRAEGNYLDDKYDGMFKMYGSNNLYVNCEYKQGEKNGTYEIGLDVNGGMHKEYGFYKDGEKDGSWKTVFIGKDGKEKVTSYVSYKDGKKEGKAIDVIGDSIIFGTYKNGNLNGPCKMYRDNLKSLLDIETDTTSYRVSFIEKGNYIDGKKDGLWIEGNDNRLKVYETGLYKNGDKQGKWVMIQNDSDNTFYGQTICEVNYTDGYENGLLTKYMERVYDSIIDRNVYKRILETVNYNKGKRFGKYCVKDTSGNTFVVGEYYNDNRAGIWRMNDESKSQSPEFISEFENGELRKTICSFPKENEQYIYEFSQKGEDIRCVESFAKNGKILSYINEIVYPEAENLKELPEFYSPIHDSTLIDGGSIYYDEEGRIEEIQYFKKGEPTGLWKTYDYKNNIYNYTDFSNNEKETYYSIDTNELFTGSFEDVDEKENKIGKFYVKKGDIQKVEVRNFEGRLLKVIKYKKGLPNK